MTQSDSPRPVRRAPGPRSGDAPALAAAPGPTTTEAEECGLARDIGAHHDARALLEEALRASAAAGQVGPQFDRLLEDLLRLHLNARHVEGAAALLDQYLPLTRGTPATWLLAARVHAGGGALELAHNAIRQALTAP